MKELQYHGRVIAKWVDNRWIPEIGNSKTDDLVVYIFSGSVVFWDTVDYKLVNNPDDLYILSRSPHWNLLLKCHLGLVTIASQMNGKWIPRTHCSKLGIGLKYLI